MTRTTFLIGNGFDINAGFDTRYSDFIEYYVHTDSELPVIGDFKKDMETDKETWADAEIALGNITAKFDNIADFLICYQDFCVSLGNYLRQEISQIDYSDARIKSNMVTALLKYADYLTEYQKIKIETLHNNIGGNYRFDFVNFNYTNIFDRCIDVARDSSKSTVVYRLGSADYPLVWGDIEHIHGDLSSPLLLGVNDESQIANKEFLKNRKFMRQFIKPLTNEGLQTMRDENVRSTIERSNIICIYGMSLGATDRIWWKQIVSWLRSKETHYLVIFTLASNYNPNLSSSFLDTEEDVQNRLFSYVQLSEKDQDVLRKQIFVAINQPLFNFKLTRLTESKESA